MTRDEYCKLSDIPKASTLGRQIMSLNQDEFEYLYMMCDPSDCRVEMINANGFKVSRYFAWISIE